MERKVKFVIAYDGTDFHGWQTQPGLRTVQDEIEQVLRRVVGHPLNLVAASRTDAGVHARGQCAHVVTTTPMPAGNLGRSLSHRLPADIEILSAQEAAPNFHATQSAVCKCYRYRLLNRPRQPREVFLRRTTWHVWYRLDLAVMQAAAAALVGTHDFVGFATAGSPRQTTVRTIQSATVERIGDELVIEFVGDGFLYNQVRNMVGTLIEVGRGHWPLDRIGRVLSSGDRTEAGTTAPPQGLCLEWVRYE